MRPNPVRTHFLCAAVSLALTLLLGRESGAQESAYLVQAGDVLQVSVWKETALQSEVLVRPDGGLSFPLTGDIDASGHTVEQIRQALESNLKKYIPDPVVTVAVKVASGSRIFVLGKVNHPGDFQLSRPLDVMQALSLAGGGTPYADLNDIRILRRQGGRQTVLRFNYGEVSRGRDLPENVLLQSGDTVVVP